MRLPVYVSPCVSYNALEVVYLYCFFMRFYNGDEESREDVVASIAKHSSVLSKNAVFSSADEVVASLMSDSRLQQLVEQEAKVESLESEKEERFCMMVFFDVLTLLETPHYLIDALAHLTILIRAVWPKDIGKERNGRFSLVLCNPPYERGGFENISYEKAVCRKEITITLAEILDAAARLLKFGGRIDNTDIYGKVVCE